ncbi:DUF2516 family protein [Actinotalea sp.]|uniref:DUF2516 family protein n=1 Tax=Actinotalea sp. TaxID=1872145 RepID=UPI003567C8A2
MIRTLQVYIFLALYLAVFVMSLVAFLDAVRRPAAAFPAAGKRTKQFWTTLLGVALAVAFVAIPAPIGLGLLSFLALGSAVAALVYQYDVKPALGPMRRGPRGPQSGGGW